MDGLKKYSSSGMKKKETFWFVEEKGLKKGLLLMELPLITKFNNNIMWLKLATEKKIIKITF